MILILWTKNNNRDYFLNNRSGTTLFTTCSFLNEYITPPPASDLNLTDHALGATFRKITPKLEHLRG